MITVSPALPLSAQSSSIHTMQVEDDTSSMRASSNQDQCDEGVTTTTAAITVTNNDHENDIETNGIIFHSYRKRLLRKGSIHSHLHRRNRSIRGTFHSPTSLSSIRPCNTESGATSPGERNGTTITKPNDRVSPTSIADFPHRDSELLYTESFNHMDDEKDMDDVHVSSSSFEYVTFLNLLQHPLAKTQDTDVDIVQPLSSEKTVSLVRTCTPRDTLFENSIHSAVEPIEKEIEKEIQYMIEKDLKKRDPLLTSVGILASNDDTIQLETIPDARPLRRFCSFPTQWNSFTFKSRTISNDDILDDLNGEKKDIQPTLYSKSILPKDHKLIASALKKQRSLPLLAGASSASLNVTFNEMMEVRYFYRSDDEMEIMRQCAIERRMQMESRKRLRRRLRKGQALFLQSTKKKNSLLSYFGGSSWSTGEEKCANNLNEEKHSYYDTPHQRSIVHCGIPFACYDDSENDDKSNNSDKDANTTTGENTKSWLEGFTKPVPSSTAEISLQEEECSINRKVDGTVDTSTNSFLHDLVNGFTGIQLMTDDMFNNVVVTTTQDDTRNTKEATKMLDQWNGTPTMMSTTTDDITESAESPWLISALTCGHNIFWHK